jgi:NADPH:quinone reductase-like Zn-dependent oxidoreductase
VGGALVQLAKRRGARVIAMASEAKHGDVAKLGRTGSRARRRICALRWARRRITVVADIVGGPYWPNLIDILERGGRYVCSGAIAGPMVELDLRTFYLATSP